MLQWMDDDLHQRRQLGLLRRRQRIDGRGVHIRIDGVDLLSFASNDYLDLASDPRLAEASANAARDYGTGATAAPLVRGYLPIHAELEATLVAWEQCEAALTFASGYSANLAATSGLAGRGDLILSDALNHASLIDGCRLSRATVQVYHHADVNHVESLMHQHAHQHRRCFIVTDTVFGMDGDVAPLADLIDLAARWDALVIIDEAHATGVLGPTGAGLVEQLAPEQRGDPDRLIKVGTLSKALGTQGGFVVGTRQAIDYLLNHGRSYIFSTGLAPPSAAAALTAIRIAQVEHERRTRLRTLSSILTNALGLAPSATPIIPIIIGSAEAVMHQSARLRSAGLFIPAIRPPTVPEGTARLRISLSAGHSESDVQRLIDVLRTMPATP